MTALEVSFADVRDEVQRSQAAKGIAEDYERRFRTLGPSEWSSYQHQLDAAIVRLLDSSLSSDQLGGLELILELTHCDASVHDFTRVTNFANYLRQPLASSDAAVAARASHCLGQLARAEGGHAAVKPALDQALRRLKEGNRLDSAVLVLVQLAEHAPTLTYVHLSEICDHLWTAIRDPRVSTRQGAAAVLRACLALVASRPGHARERWYARVYDEAQKGLASGASTEIVHGALLTIAELLDAPGARLTERQLDTLFEGAWACRNHRDKAVRRAVLDVPPRMAAHCERSSVEEVHRGAKLNLFESNFLNGSVALMLTALRSPPYQELRHLVFQAIGEIALHTKATIHSRQEPLQPLHRRATAPSSNPRKGSIFGAGPSVSVVELRSGAPLDAHPLVEKLPELLQELKESLGFRKAARGAKGPLTASPEAIQCIENLAISMGPTLSPYIADLMPHLFASGLSPALLSALQAIAKHVPSELPLLQRNVLDAVAATLTRLPFDEWCQLPRKDRTGAFALASADAPGAVDGAGTGTVLALAVQTLGMFSGEDWHTADLVLRMSLEMASHFLDAPLPEVRRAATVACTKLLNGALFSASEELHAVADEADRRLLKSVADGGNGNGVGVTFANGGGDAGIDARERIFERSELRRTLSMVLQKVLLTGVVDADAQIRHQVFSSLGDRFDKQLAQPEALRAILMAIDDGSPAIRLSTAAMLGRIAHVSPALVLPRLRGKLLQLTNEIAHGQGAMQVEQSIRIVGSLASTANRLIEPYASSLLGYLTPRLTDGHLNVVAASLFALEQLARTSPEAVRPQGDSLIPLAVGVLNLRSGSAVRGGALGALAQLVRAQGDALKPYERHPSLLHSVLQMLQVEQSDDTLRIHLMRLIGVLGAVDPATHTRRTLQMQREPAKPSPVAAMSGSEPEYYHAVAVHALDNLLRDDAQSKLRFDATVTLTKVCLSLGAKCSRFVSSVVPALVKAIESHSPSKWGGLLERITSVVRCCSRSAPHKDAAAASTPDAAAAHLAALLPLIRRLWADADKEGVPPEARNDVRKKCLLLMEALYAAVEPAHFAEQLPMMLPMLLSLLAVDHRGTRSRSSSHACLHALSTFRSALHDQLHTIVPALLGLLEPASDAAPELRAEVLSLLASLVAEHDVYPFAAPVVHTLARALEGPCKVEAVKVLCIIALRLDALYLVFEPVVHAAMRRQLGRGRAAFDQYEQLARGCEQYEQVVHALMQGEGADLDQRFRFSSTASTSQATRSRIGSVIELPGELNGEQHRLSLVDEEAEGMAKRHMDRAQLARAWDIQQRTTSDDWRDWMRTFALTLLKESPSAALRYCSVIAERSLPLRVELFNAAFVSCWDELMLQEEQTVRMNGGKRGSAKKESGGASELVTNLQIAMEHEHMPSDLIQRLLNLAEYMERRQTNIQGSVTLGLAWSKLGSLAERCHAYTKALRYKELEFEEALPSRELVEGLVSINYLLGQTEAAKGILEYHSPTLADDTASVENPLWHERLEEYKQALDGYEALAAKQPENATAKIGRMRCQHALGDWSSLSDLAAAAWAEVPHGGAFSEQGLSEVAELGAAAAFSLALHARTDSAASTRWLDVERYTDGMRRQSAERSFYKAVIELRSGGHERCQQHIDAARAALYEEVASLVSESYSRAYVSVLKLQRLAELEEVLAHKTCPEAMPISHLTALWDTRLDQVKRSVDVWQPLLAVHWLAAPPHTNTAPSLRFAQLCQTSRRRALAVQTLHACGAPQISREQPSIRRWFNVRRSVIGTSALSRRSLAPPSPVMARASPSTSPNPRATMPASPPADFLGKDSAAKLSSMPLRVWFGFASFLWHDGERHKAMHCMRLLLDKHGGDSTAGDELYGWQEHFASSAGPISPDVGLSAKAWRRFGEWQEQMPIEGAAATADSDLIAAELYASLKHYRAAAKLDPKSYKAWHSLALVHFGVVQGATQELVEEAEGSSAESKRAALRAHIVPAITCFFRSIALGAASQRSLQDILRLLTLWFQHGGDAELGVNAAIVKGLEGTPVDTWLSVIPQLIARIGNPSKDIRDAVCDLLIRLGSAHPQGLCFPLTVASHSHVGATQVLDAMRRQYDTLVQQAHLVASELIRTAALWSEQWQEALTEASALYFGSGDVDGMIATLEPYHKMMQNAPQTLAEVTFEQSFGRQLELAWSRVKRYQQSGEEADINSAWEVYKQCYGRITAKNRALSRLELAYVSPALHAARDLELAVPGTYRPGVPFTRIRSFARSMTVIVSKQRPRIMSMHGDDGAEHRFLLKGHEDLRQDERVMQLFGLVNTLLSVEQETAHASLAIITYSVIPLSPTSGLIRWVPNAPTFNTLINGVRKARRVPETAEKDLINRFSPRRTPNVPGCERPYDGLPLLQKVDVFQAMLDSTKGDALAQVLWSGSLTAERWVDRRTKYTRSLAVMSMVGYILGLGDRHLSNMMLDQVSGEVVHIDFGDCFEVAIHRDKFPETVPFRLTRMLVEAMGVSGVEGNFRSTCEAVMGVLHRHKDSVMAMLEAFLHDPLLNWRLIEDANGEGKPATTSAPSGLTVEAAVRIDRNVDSVIMERTLHMHAAVAEVDEKLLNARAMDVLRRVEAKLEGTDAPRDWEPMEFPSDDASEDTAAGSSDVAAQVDRLIGEAQNPTNLCRLYWGWSPFL